MPGVLQAAVAISIERPKTEADYIALAYSMCEPGQSMTFHEEWCAISGDNPDGCNCEPLVVTVPLPSLA